ncbi:Protein similar to CwfJ C-terminus 2 [Nesidiocoris tenuis]|uniref:Protein similar to CwfJ C-terminus 2 n=1 Tax=Nesidiocoris tenuis TaxID=355587 RepID=A0ABN7AE80_9HEMI|nr:Protein similar to CwfJ C-terminus 2 [Nesidiocoris tenuis]
MEDDTVPLVFVGNINKDFNKAFKKLRSVSSLLSPKDVNEVTTFVCGNMFGNATRSTFKKEIGASEVPVRLYTLGPMNENQKSFYQVPNSEVSSEQDGQFQEDFPNIFRLGKHGVFKLVSGVTVAYLNGLENEKSTDWSFNSSDIDAMIKTCSSHKEIDVLLTYQWPFGVDKADPTGSIKVSGTSKLIGRLVVALKPKMHFAANTKVSFVSPQMGHRSVDGDVPEVTQFIGLTDFEHYKEGKWVYALKYPIGKKRKPVQPQIEIPFTYAYEDDKINKFFYDAGGKRKGQNDPSHKKKRRNVNPSIDSGNCWFCLGNPNVERSLILAVADHVYLTLAKGPVVDKHLILSPINHVNSLSTADRSIQEEIDKFLKALTKCYKPAKKHLVWYERCYRSPHFQVECYILGSEDVDLIDSQIKEMANAKNLKLKQVTDSRSLSSIKSNQECPNYFYVRVGEKKSYMIDIANDSDFPMNFGRAVIATAIGLQDRIRWQECVPSQDEIADAVRDFKKEFSPFDFTMDDDDE